MCTINLTEMQLYNNMKMGKGQAGIDVGPQLYRDGRGLGGGGGRWSLTIMNVDAPKTKDARSAKHVARSKPSTFSKGCKIHASNRQTMTEKKQRTFHKEQEMTANKQTVSLEPEIGK
jgi:hypothetical protein